jgi:carbonic anhydrase
MEQQYVSNLDSLLKNNRHWAARMRELDPQFFEQLSQQQTPEYLWIGCSDSRVPANQIIGLMPGEVFVHRNVANVVAHGDLNCLSVIQYAVEALKVKHIIVCGHYGCGGVEAALNQRKLGLIDNWLRYVQDVARTHMQVFSKVEKQHHHDVMCELNVIEQVLNVSQTTIVQDAWARGQDLTVHGWVYSIQNGLIQDLGVTIDRIDQTTEVAAEALRAKVTAGLMRA